MMSLNIQVLIFHTEAGKW